MLDGKRMLEGGNGRRQLEDSSLEEEPSMLGRASGNRVVAVGREESWGSATGDPREWLQARRGRHEAPRRLVSHIHHRNPPALLPRVG